MRVAWCLLVLVAAVFADRPLWVAVGPRPLLEQVRPLAKHRESQGMEVRLLEWSGKMPPLEPRPSYLLLVGDFDRSAEPDSWTLPAPHVEFYRWRAAQPKTFATDAPHADLDGDGYADFPVGRIPARQPAQVAVVVAKTLAYERRRARIEDLTIAVWAGASGYGEMMDAMQTGLLMTTVRDHAPDWSAPWMISSDSRQPLCGWPPDQPQRFMDRMRRGSLVNAAIAHGNADGIFAMKHGEKSIWLNSGHARQMIASEPTAPLILLACNCGEFDRGKTSFAEEMVLATGGPVATIGATTESHPLPNYFSGVCLLKTLGGEYGRRERLGDVWLEAQRRAAKERNLLMENLLKGVEGKLEEEIDVARLREDQQRMYVLLGDPAVRLPLPEPLVASVRRTDAGWTWKAAPPEGATALRVGYRPVRRKAVRPARPDDVEGRRARFVEANAAEGYSELASIPAGEAWQGSHDSPGKLRLVAVGGPTLRVAVLALEE